MNNKFYPVSLNLNYKLCIVVGGGSVAVRRVNGLLEAGAVVKIISPSIHPELEDLVKLNSKLSWISLPYTSQEDLQGASLVFAATDDSKLNLKIKEDADLLGVFTNIASDGNLGDFIIPSSFNQGDLQISISTSAKVPGLSKAIKANLEQDFTPDYIALVTLLEEIRNVAISNPDQRIKNRHILSDITANYLSILNQIRSGIDLKVLHEQLLERLK